MILFLACTPPPASDRTANSDQADADTDTDTDADGDSDADADTDAKYAGAALAAMEEASLIGQEEVWTRASTPSVSRTGSLPLILLAFTEDETCPTVTEAGETTTFTGGCTDEEGLTWMGTMVVGPAGFAAEGFGVDEPDDECPGESYVIVIDGTLTIGAEWTFDLVMQETDGDDACELQDVTLALAYTGTSASSGPDDDGDGDGDVTTYSGAGTYGRSDIGKAEVSTANEVLDDSVCADEAASGETAVSAGGNTIVYTYDGATDCDAASTVRWSFDGVDQGEIEDVSW